MNDEHRVTALLDLAADVPERIQPPVGALLNRARRARRNRVAVVSGLTAAVMIGAAAGLPLLASAPAPSGPAAPLGPGGHGVTAAGLSRYHWITLARSPLGRVTSPVTAWTGTELLELGKADVHAGRAAPAAAFSPASGRWHAIASPPDTIDTSGAVTAWTGHLLFVTNAQVPPLPWPPDMGPPAGLYDPVTNRWSVTDLPVQLAELNPVSAAWTGRLVIVAGVRSGTVLAASFDPVTGRWRVINPPLPRRHEAMILAMAGVGARVLIWSLWSRGPTVSIGYGVDVAALERGGRWRIVTGGWPQNRTVPQPVFTGSRILVPPSASWCGVCPGPLAFNPAYLANPATLRGVFLPRGPLDMGYPPLVWTGGAAIAVTGSDAWRSGQPAAAAAWDPVSDRWHRLPGPPGDVQLPAEFRPAPVWTGSQLLLLPVSGRLLAFRG